MIEESLGTPLMTAAISPVVPPNISIPPAVPVSFGLYAPSYPPLPYWYPSYPMTTPPVTQEVNVIDLRAVVIVVGSQDIMWPSAIPNHLVMKEESEDIMVGIIIRRISVTVAKRRKRKIIINQHTREDGRKRLIDP
jgi:hypothetical protein